MKCNSINNDKIPIIHEDKLVYILVQDLIKLIITRINLCGNSDAICIAEYAKKLAEQATSKTEEALDKAIKALTLAVKAYELSLLFNSRLTVLEEKDLYLEDIRNTLISLSQQVNVNTLNITTLLASKIFKITPNILSNYVEYIFQIDLMEIGRIKVFNPNTYYAGNHIQISEGNVINAVGFAEVAFTGDYGDLNNTPINTYHMVSKLDGEYVKDLKFFDVYINYGTNLERYYRVTHLDWHDITFTEGETCTLDVAGVDAAALYAINGQLIIFTTENLYPDKYTVDDRVFFHWNLSGIHCNPIIYGNLASEDAGDSDIKVYLNSLEGPVILETDDFELGCGGKGSFPFKGNLKEGYYLDNSPCYILDWNPVSMFPKFSPNSNNPQDILISKFPKHGYIIVKGPKELNPEPEDPQLPIPPTYYSLTINYKLNNTDRAILDLPNYSDIIERTDLTGNSLEENEPCLITFNIIDTDYEYDSVTAVMGPSTYDNPLITNTRAALHIPSVVANVILTVVVKKKVLLVLNYNVHLQGFDNKVLVSPTVIPENYRLEYTLSFINNSDSSLYSIKVNSIYLGSDPTDTVTWSSSTSNSTVILTNLKKGNTIVSINSDVTIVGELVNKTVTVTKDTPVITNFTPTGPIWVGETSKTFKIYCSDAYDITLLRAYNSSGDIVVVNNPQIHTAKGGPYYELTVTDFSKNVVLTCTYQEKVVEITNYTISLDKTLTNAGFRILKSTEVTSYTQEEGTSFGCITIVNTKRPYIMLVSATASKGNLSKVERWGDTTEELVSHAYTAQTLEVFYTNYNFCWDTLIAGDIIITGEIADVTPAPIPIDPENYEVSLAGELAINQKTTASQSMQSILTDGIAEGGNTSAVDYYIQDDRGIRIIKIVTHIGGEIVELPLYDSINPLVVYSNDNKKVGFNFSNVQGSIIIYGSYLTQELGAQETRHSGKYYWFEYYPNTSLPLNDAIILSEPISEANSSESLLVWVFKLILLSAGIFVENQQTKKWEYQQAVYDLSRLGWKNLDGNGATDAQIGDDWIVLARKDSYYNPQTRSGMVHAIINILPRKINRSYNDIILPYKIGYNGIPGEISSASQQLTINTGVYNNTNIPLYSFASQKVHKGYPNTKYRFRVFGFENLTEVDWTVYPSNVDDWLRFVEPISNNSTNINNQHTYKGLSGKSLDELKVGDKYVLGFEMCALLDKERYYMPLLEGGNIATENWGPFNPDQLLSPATVTMPKGWFIVKVTESRGGTWTSLEESETNVSIAWCDVKVTKKSTSGTPGAQISNNLHIYEEELDGRNVSSHTTTWGPDVVNRFEIEITPKAALAPGTYEMSLSIGPYGSNVTTEENPNLALKTIILNYTLE